MHPAQSPVSPAAPSPCPFPGTPSGWHKPPQRSGFSCLCTGMIRVSATQGDGRDGKPPGATGGHSGEARPGTPGHATRAGHRLLGPHSGGEPHRDRGQSPRWVCQGQDTGDAQPGVPTITPMIPSFPSRSARGFACKQQPLGNTFNPSPPLGYYSSPANLKASPFFSARHPQSRGNSSALT